MDLRLRTGNQQKRAISNHLKLKNCLASYKQYSYPLHNVLILGDSQLQGLLGNLDQQQLLQLLSGYGGLAGHGGLSSAGSSIAAPTAGSPT